MGVIIKLLRFILLLFLLIPSFVFGATYYMSAGGTGSKATSQTDCDTAMSIVTHNGETFTAGDTFKLCDTGGNYNATSGGIIPPTTGTSGNLITYEAETGDTPVISGLNLLTSTWTDETGGVWSYDISGETNKDLIFAVYKDDSQMDTSVYSFTAAEWSAEASNEYSVSYFDSTIGAVYKTAVSDMSALALGSGAGSLSDNEYVIESNKLYIQLASGGYDVTAEADDYIRTVSHTSSSLGNDTWFLDNVADKLYVKLTGGAVPLNSQITTASLIDRCFSIIDKEYITIQNIQCQHPRYEGMLVTLTDNKTNYIIDNFDAIFIGTRGIHFNVTDNKTATNVTIQNSDIQWGRNYFYDYPGGDIGGIHLDEGDFTTVLIDKNYVYQIGADEQSNGSGFRNSIFIENPLGLTITDNEVYGGDHGITIINEDNNSCGSVALSHNYVHDTIDDNSWINGCVGTVTDCLIYANEFVTTGDNNIDFEDSICYVINNLFAYAANASFDGQNNDITTSAGFIQNNIFIRDNGDDAFIQCLGTSCDAVDFTIDRNSYYDSSSTYGNLFEAQDINGGSATNWAGWQNAITNLDSYSLYDVDPELGASPTYIPDNNLFQNRGADFSGQSVELLNTGTVWPDNVVTTAPTYWPVGHWNMECN